MQTTRLTGGYDLLKVKNRDRPLLIGSCAVKRGTDLNRLEIMQSKRGTVLFFFVKQGLSLF